MLTFPLMICCTCIHRVQTTIYTVFTEYRLPYTLYPQSTDYHIHCIHRVQTTLCCIHRVQAIIYTVSTEYRLLYVVSTEYRLPVTLYPQSTDYSMVVSTEATICTVSAKYRLPYVLYLQSTDYSMVVSTEYRLLYVVSTDYSQLYGCIHRVQITLWLYP